MKGLIIYKSNYGATKQYAEWLAQDLGFEVQTNKDVSDQEIKNSEIIVIGSPVMANKPFLASWIKKKADVFKGKKIVLYTTSGTPPEDEKLEKGFELSIPEGLRDSMKYFPLGGRMIFSKLNWVHKLMMKIGVIIEKDPVAKKKMVEDVDNVSKDQIEKIGIYVKSL